MNINVYEMVTNRIIEQLENGIIPWIRPWKSVCGAAFNRVSRHPYSFLNQMLLSHEGEYATFNQWRSLGGCVRKGEKSEIVVFWKLLEAKDEKAEQDGEAASHQIPFLRYHNVFHISQVDGVEPLSESELPERGFDLSDGAEDLFAGYLNREGIELRQEESNRAFYSPSSDVISLPVAEQFTNMAEYYSTMFHETVHSTGHPSRLGRFDPSKKVARFGSADYSVEELVAEIGAATILNLLGIETCSSFRNNAAYIQNWLGVLRNDNKFIVSASSKAEKAVNYIMGRDQVST